MKKRKLRKFQVATAILMSFSLMVPSVLNVNQVEASENGEGITIPEPIKVITADDLRQIATETLTGEAVEEVSDGAVKPTIGYTVDSELVLKNPFGSKELQKNMKEYEEWATADEITWKRYAQMGYAQWNKGLTLSYWINVPGNEQEGYASSSVLRWEMDDEEIHEANGYAAYLVCRRYHEELKSWEDKESWVEAAKKEESKVVYGSDFYFKYILTDGVDEDGAPLPKIYPQYLSEKEKIYGPVYDGRFFEIYGSNDDDIIKSKFYYYNPNFQPGYIYTADGGYEMFYLTARYNNFNTLYMSEKEIREHLNLDESCEVTPGTVYVDEETGHRYSTNSWVGVVDGYGEFQIDTDNSVMWLSDDETGIQKNINKESTYGKATGMQSQNCFYMNSWGNLDQIDREKVSYDTALQYGLSPVTSIDASGEAIKYGNCNQWHQVTITLQNDWVEFYVDGKLVDVHDNYSTCGLGYIKCFQYLNKGMGLRSCFYGSDVFFKELNYGRFVCRLFMDWLTDEDATLHIGGVGKNAAKYNLADSAKEFSIDEMRFYDQLLTEEQIVEAYEEQEGRLLNGENNPNQGIITPPGVSSEPVSPGPVTAEAVYLGDVNGDDKISLEDATKILRFALLLAEPESEKQRLLADVDESGNLELADATKALRMALLLDEWKEVEYLVK